MIDVEIKKSKNPNKKYGAIITKKEVWNKPTIEASIKDTNKRFKNLNIKKS